GGGRGGGGGDGGVGWGRARVLGALHAQLRRPAAPRSSRRGPASCGHGRTLVMDRSAPAWRQALSRDDISTLLEMHDWRSWRSIAVNWGLVAASLARVARWPH